MATHDIGRLDVVLETGNLILEVLKRDLLVLDNQADLQLADTVTDGHQLRGTPNQTVLLNATDGRLQGLYVGLVIYNEKWESVSKHTSV